MSRKPSYDEIVRRTVPEPDSSFRPTSEQIAEAGEASRAQRLHAQMTEDERALYAQIAQTLQAYTHFGDVGFELDGSRLTLRGRVHHVGAIAQIEHAVATVAGIDHVDNRLVVDGRAEPRT